MIGLRFGTKNATFLATVLERRGFLNTMDKHDPSSPTFEQLLLPDSPDRSDSESDPVARLLGHASRVEPSPFFARNILREIRMQPSGPIGIARLWLRRPHLLLGSAFAMLIALLVAAYGLRSPTGSHGEAGDSALAAVTMDAAPSLAVAFDPEDEIEAVEYLGQLMAITDPGDLSDEALANLFY